MPQCKVCQAEIMFIRTEKGRQMPFSGALSFVLPKTVEVKPITVITSLGKTIKAFVPHWANCPGASKLRKAE